MTTSPSSTASPPYRTLAMVAIGIGALLLLASVCAALAFVLVPTMSSDQALVTNTSVLSLGAVTLGYGTLLLFIGLALRQGKLTAPIRLPSPILFIVLFVVVLIIGQIILARNIATTYSFPFFHVLASLLVPLTVLAYAIPRLGPASLRSMLAQFTWGGLVTIALALVFELLIGSVLFVLAVLAFAFALGTERLTALVEQLRFSTSDPQRIIQVLSQDPFAILIAAVTAILLFVVIVPLLEELIKATGPALLISRRSRAHATVTKSEALLWGLAAGAGYAFTENMFNAQGTLTDLTSPTSFWAVIMLLRAGTSLMHITATATVSIGWYHALVNKNKSRLVLLLAAATLAHAIWNSTALLAFGASAVNNANGNSALLSTLFVSIVWSCLALLFILFLIWLRRLIRWAQPPVEIIPSNVTSLEIKG